MGKHCARWNVWCCSVLLLPSLGLMPATASAKDGFTLAGGVPSDVFLYVAGRHNPNADFVHGYWGEVWEAFHASGIIDDVMGMITASLGEQQKTEMERLKGLATQLCAGVDWAGLGGGEMVYTMRMPKPIQQGENFNVGPADMAWIIKGKSGSAAKNFDGLTAILESVAAEINKVAGSDVVSVNKTPIGDTKASSLSAAGAPPGVPSLTVANPGDIILITVSDKFQNEIIDLLKGGSGKSLAQTDRFKTAFAGLPAAEDAMVFVDMQQMLKDLHGIVDQGFSFGERMAAANTTAPTGSETPGAAAKPMPEMTAEAAALDKQAMDAYAAKDYAKALALCEKALAASPDHPRIQYNMACFSNLTGNREQALTYLEKAVDGGFDDATKIGGDSDLETLRSDAKFQTILAKAQAASANRPAGGGGDSVEDLKIARNIVNRLIDMPAIVDYIAEVETTDGYSTHNESIVMLASDASTKPFYPIVTHAKPVGDYATYLPQEASSFSVQSGLDWKELYKFIEDTIKVIGPKGEEVLAMWSSFQQQSGFDLQRDVLAWMGSEMISVTMQRPTGEASVSMLKVSDEKAAAEKVNSGLDALAAFIQKNAQSNPMMGMMNMRSAPCLNEKLAGFRNVFFGMAPTPMVLGVSKGYLIFGSSEDAVLTCLATAAGEHPNVTTNADVMAQAIKPDKSATAVSFEDMRQLGNQLAGAAGMISMMGGFAAMAVPDPEGQQMIGKITAILGKLSPVLQKIDFYRSNASVCSFDGKSWRTKSVIHYQSPEQRKASAAPAPAAETKKM